MSNRLKMISLLLAALLGCLACGDDEGGLSLFSKDDAARYLEAWVNNLAKGKYDLVQKDSELPFRFRSRTWKSEKEFSENIAKHAPELKASLERANAEGGKIDYFSYQDLENGTWPERASVAEDDRAAAMSKLGIRPDGFVAWVHVGRRTVARFVLNPPGSRDRLVLQGIDPR